MSKAMNTKFFLYLSLALLIFGVPSVMALWKNEASQRKCQTMYVISTGQLKTTGTVEVLYTHSDSTAETSAGNATLIGSEWCIDLSAAQTNSDSVSLRWHSTSSLDLELSRSYSTAIRQTGDSYGHVNNSIYGLSAIYGTSTAVKAKTDSLTFTVAGKADTNVTHVNNSAQTAGDIMGAVNAANLYLQGHLSGSVDGVIAAGTHNNSSAEAAATATATEAAIAALHGNGSYDATAAGDPAPTVGEIADAVWDELVTTHTNASSTGKALSDAGAAGTPPTVQEIVDEFDARHGSGPY